MMEKLEGQLLERLKSDDRKTFEIIFKTYYSQLCNYATEIVKIPELAEDLVKDIFLKLWENRAKLTIESNLSGYLYRCTRNLCLNSITRNPQQKYSLHFEESVNILENSIEERRSESPLDILLIEELEDNIRLEIEKLTPRQKEIFELSRFHGLSHKEIAKKMNISVNTVKVQIYKALVEIRSGLSIYFSKK